jgi:hypothetical protein
VFTNNDSRVSTVVMAHPARREQAEQLQRRHPELEAEIVYDPDPGAPPATLRTAKAAWSRIRPGATHHLVLQEDVQLCHDFKSVLHQALSVAPEGAIALHANWTMATAQAVRLAALCGASWTPAVDSWTPTQGLILRAEVAQEFASFCERFGPNKPDNFAMADYLAHRGLKAYIAIPNLVEHRPTPSLLCNDLLYGLRHSVVFPESADVGPAPFTDAVLAPPAIAHLGLSGFEIMCHYDPLISAKRSPTTGHEALITHGMSAVELAESFRGDLDYHPEAKAQGWSDTLLFNFWLAMFIQGVIARGLPDLSKPDDLEDALNNHRWARHALDTFAASGLRKTFALENLRSTARQLTPLCISALRSGFAAVDHWPDLAALWRPDVNDIRPRWNRDDDAPKT